MYGLISNPYVCKRGPSASRKPNSKAPNAVLYGFHPPIITNAYAIHPRPEVIPSVQYGT